MYDNMVERAASVVYLFYFILLDSAWMRILCAATVIIKEELSAELPRDIAEIVTDRLFISLTNSRGHNLLVSQFNSR